LDDPHPEDRNSDCEHMDVAGEEEAVTPKRVVKIISEIGALTITDTVTTAKTYRNELPDADVRHFFAIREVFC
jgi:hypothetical protein